MKLYLFINQITWLEISYICVSIGAMATAISLIYLFIKDFKKSNKISQLERVAQTLQKDLELKYQPHLWINGIQLRNNENRINFDLNNKREWCKLIELNIISGDLLIDEPNLHFPFELEPKFDPNIINDTNRRYLFFINNSIKNLDDCNYSFEIVYLDRLENKYAVEVNGTGLSCRMSQPKNK